MAVTALTPTDPTTDPTAVPKPTPATKPVAATPVAPLTKPVPNTPAAPTATAPKPMIDPAPPMVSAPVSGPPANGVTSIPGITPTNPTTPVASTATTGSSGNYSYKDPATGMTIRPGTGVYANKLTFTEPASGKTYYSLGNGTQWEEVGTNAAYTGTAPNVGVTPSAGGGLNVTPGSAYAGYQDYLKNTNYANEAAQLNAEKALPQAASAYAPGDSVTLSGGVITKNGTPVGVTNEFGAVVDPSTGQLSNAGGAVAAQAQNYDNGQAYAAPAGLPPSVNGTPIAQWMQSMGIAPQGTPDATGSLIPSGGGNGSGAPGSAPSTGGAPASPVSGPSATGVTTANSPISTLLPNGPTTSGPYANTQQIVPGGATDLTSQLITPGQGTDRLQLAKQYEDAWNAATNPQFAADQRDVARQMAALGATGSGREVSSLGDVLANRDTARNAAMQNFLTNAQEGSIEDAFRKLGILQQQQGFQAGQQNTAFNQGLLQNEVGNMNNPDTLLAELAAQYNQQAGQAAGSVGQLAQASSANQNGQIPAWLLPLLQGASGQYAPPPTSTATGGY